MNVRNGKLFLYGKKFISGTLNPYLIRKEKRNAAFSKNASTINNKNWINIFLCIA
jgi:hypothetical protein